MASPEQVAAFREDWGLPEHCSLVAAHDLGPGESTPRCPNRLGGVVCDTTVRQPATEFEKAVRTDADTTFIFMSCQAAVVGMHERAEAEDSRLQ